MNKIPILNQIIKTKRKEMKLNQLDFSKIINKSKVTVARYDTGDIIPQNTLILICDLLNLDYGALLLEQYEENKKNNTTYYENLIYSNDKEIISIEDIVKKNLDIFTNKQNIKLLKKKLTLLYSFNDCKLDVLPFYCEYKDNRFYIKKSSNNEVVQVLNINEAHSLLEEMNDFLEYRKFKLNKTQK